MENWSNDIWFTVITAFVIGVIVGYTILRFTNDNVQKHHKTSQELKEANAKLEAQKVQLEQHFSTSAELLATMAEDYKKLYSHLAESSQQILPDSGKIALFDKPLITEDSKKDDPPKDYSEGSSGLLKS